MCLYTPQCPPTNAHLHNLPIKLLPSNINTHKLPTKFPLLHSNANKISIKAPITKLPLPTINHYKSPTKTSPKAISKIGKHSAAATHTTQNHTHKDKKNHLHLPTSKHPHQKTPKMQLQTIYKHTSKKILSPPPTSPHGQMSEPPIPKPH